MLDKKPVSPYIGDMKFGDVLEGIVTDVDEKGRGLFFHPLPQTPGEVRTVVVPFTAPGDNIQATFAKRDRGQWIGKLNHINSSSADRVSTPCPHAGVGGGCLWQHLDYNAQRALKQTMINRAFEKAGHMERVTSVLPSPDVFYYRNRMDYVIGWQGQVGLKEYGAWNRYIDLSTCLLLDDTAPTILQTVRDLMRDLKLEPWDAKRQTGLMRYTVIRLGKNTDERMIMLVVKDASAFDEGKRQELRRRLAPLCTTLYLGENPTITDLSIATTLDLLHGNEYLTEMINGITYRIHPNSFFQTNSGMATALQNTVLDLLGDLKGKKILDLYCGLGFFGIACAKRGAQVYGLELDAPAIELARQNAERNQVAELCQWESGAVEDKLAVLIQQQSCDTIIVDPPRAGLHPKALATLLQAKPSTIVYVSCNFHRLVEELKTFKEHGYRVEQLKALDLFPQTPHVEVVTKLVREQ